MAVVVEDLNNGSDHGASFVDAGRVDDPDAYPPARADALPPPPPPPSVDDIGALSPRDVHGFDEAERGGAGGIAAKKKFGFPSPSDRRSVRSSGVPASDSRSVESGGGGGTGGAGSCPESIASRAQSSIGKPATRHADKREEHSSGSSTSSLSSDPEIDLEKSEVVIVEEQMVTSAVLHGRSEEHACDQENSERNNNNLTMPARALSPDVVANAPLEKSSGNGSGNDQTSKESLSKHEPEEQSTHARIGNKPALQPVTVHAPAGNLGIDVDMVIPIVNWVRPTSPLIDVVHLGDILVFVDGKSTAQLSHVDLTRALAKSDRPRTLVLLPGKTALYDTQALLEERRIKAAAEYEDEMVVPACYTNAVGGGDERHVACPEEMVGTRRIKGVTPSKSSVMRTKRAVGSGRTEQMELFVLHKVNQQGPIESLPSPLLKVGLDGGINGRNSDAPPTRHNLPAQSPGVNCAEASPPSTPERRRLSLTETQTGKSLPPLPIPTAEEKRERRLRREAVEEAEFIAAEKMRRAAKKGAPPTFDCISLDSRPDDISTLYGGSWHGNLRYAGMRFENGRVCAMEQGSKPGGHALPPTPLGLHDPETRRGLEEQARWAAKDQKTRELSERERRKRRTCAIEAFFILLIILSIAAMAVLLVVVFWRK